LNFSDEQLHALDALELGPIFELIPKASSPSQLASRAADLSELAHLVASCEGCALAASRTQTVFGQGVMQAAWMVIGRAPTLEDDQKGEPASGDPGKLLHALLASLGLDRERQVYVTTAVKCLPPAQHEPSASECKACQPILHRQIAQVRPGGLLLMGQAAVRGALGLDQTLEELRGRVHSADIGGAKYNAVVTYSLAQILASPGLKAKVWRDAMLMRQVQGEPLN
jgi:uracil-DNA glycosylase